jgi:hypothetical protein
MKHLCSLDSQNQFVQESFSYLKELSPDIQLQKPDWHPGKLLIDAEHGICFHLFFVSNASENFIFLQNINDFPLIDLRRNICVWQDHWYSANPILIARISSLYGKLKTIYGRKTVVNSVYKDMSGDFFEHHHLQGNAQSRFQYGLSDALHPCLALMSFSKGRKIIRNGEMYRSYEIIRFCNHTGMVVSGGMGKLIQHFIKSHQPDDIVSYVDKDWSMGESYIKLGFVPQGALPVQEFWIAKNSGKRLFPEKVKKAAGIDLDNPDAEHALFNQVAIARVYNSGSIKFIKFIKETVF